MGATTTRMGADGPELRAPHGWGAWLLVLAVLCVVGGIRWRLLDVPLERDEGEYAYGGQLLLQGVPPYTELYNMKLPGIYGAYAVVLAVFGETHRGIHLGLLVLNALTTIGVFLLGRRCLGDAWGAVAAIGFAVLSVGQTVHGVFANAEHFVLPWAVFGLWLFLRALDSGRLVTLAGSGVLLGVAVLMKQHGIVFPACAGFVLLVRLWREPGRDPRRVAGRCAVFAAGVLLPYLGTLVVMWQAGVLDAFWFWTMTYARSYTGQIPLAEAPGRFVEQSWAAVQPAAALWILVAIGVTALLWDRSTRGKRLFLGALALASILVVCPGFYFRPHYYLHALIGAALLWAVGARAMARMLPAGVPGVVRGAVVIGLVAIPVAHTLLAQFEFLFQFTPYEASRSTYGLSPFPESLPIAAWVKEHTEPDDRIAVIGSEPQIYFYSGRRSATGFIYTYPLTEDQPFARSMQEQMIAEIEEQAPKILVLVRIPQSWGARRSGADDLIEGWLGRTMWGYRLEYFADLSLERPTAFHEGDDLAQIAHASENRVEVWRRKR